MKKPRGQSTETEPQEEAIASADQAIEHCANIAAVAALLQSEDVCKLRTVFGEDAVTASGRLLAQEPEKLRSSITMLRAAVTKPHRPTGSPRGE